MPRVEAPVSYPGTIVTGQFKIIVKKSSAKIMKVTAA